MISCFKAAWNLVGHKLKNHGTIVLIQINDVRILIFMYSLTGGLPVDEKYYIPAIDDNTPLEYLVPTTSEAGVCTTALVDYLTLTHNSFIERCRAVVAENDKRYQISISIFESIKFVSCIYMHTFP